MKKLLIMLLLTNTLSAQQIILEQIDEEILKKLPEIREDKINEILK